MKNGALKKEHVKKNILFRILSGQYPLEGRVPPERDLCDVMNVSRMTIRAAVDDLIKDGILERDGRRGTLIKKIPESGTVHNKKQKRILFVYFSSIKGHLIDQFGASARLYHGIEHFANEYGHALMVQSGENFLRQPAKQHASADGIIAGGSRLEKRLPLLMDIGVPVVAADALIYSRTVDAVCSDHYEAGVIAAQKVAERNYKNPLLLIVKYENEDFIQPSFIAKQRGFMDFPSDNKIEKHQHILNYKDLFNNGSSVSKLCSLIKEKNIDCIIDCSDVICPYLQGISVIAGLPKVILGGVAENYNKMEKTELISFDVERIGYLAAERLHERMQNPCLDPIRYLVPVKTKKEH